MRFGTHPQARMQTNIVGDCGGLPVRRRKLSGRSIERASLEAGTAKCQSSMIGLSEVPLWLHDVALKPS